MDIAVIGLGRIGGALGKKWAIAGHTVHFGYHDPTSSSLENLRQQGLPNVVFEPLEEVSACPVLLLAVPFPTVPDVLKRLGSLSGKVLIDATNALPQPPQGYPTGAAAIADWAPGTRLVKAFNSTGFDNVLNPNYGGISIDTYICGDDAEAKEIVLGLAGEAGFTCVDVGQLARADLLEALARLWMQLAYGQNRGTQIAFKLLSR